jgi:hypothetical protein
MFRDRGNTRMLDSDLVERFETVYWSEHFSILLENTEPLRLIGGTQWLIDSCSHFPLNNRTYLFIYPWGNGKVSLHPRHMRDNRDIDRRKEVGSKTASFAFSPGKA